MVTGRRAGDNPRPAYAIGGAMRYTYDAVIVRDGDGYSVSFPQLPDAFTHGATREEASVRASEALTRHCRAR